MHAQRIFDQAGYRSNVYIIHVKLRQRGVKVRENLLGYG